jgi:hypothetical protein
MTCHIISISCVVLKNPAQKPALNSSLLSLKALHFACIEELGRKHPSSVQVCIPSEATNSQLLKVFMKFLDEHPELLHQPTTVLFVHSMQQAFACKK